LIYKLAVAKSVICSGKSNAALLFSEPTHCWHAQQSGFHFQEATSKSPL